MATTVNKHSTSTSQSQNIALQQRVASAAASVQWVVVGGTQPTPVAVYAVPLPDDDGEEVRLKALREVQTRHALLSLDLKKSKESMALVEGKVVQNVEDMCTLLKGQGTQISGGGAHTEHVVNLSKEYTAMTESVERLERELRVLERYIERIESGEETIDRTFIRNMRTDIFRRQKAGFYPGAKVTRPPRVLLPPIPNMPDFKLAANKGIGSAHTIVRPQQVTTSTASNMSNFKVINWLENNKASVDLTPPVPSSTTSLGSTPRVPSSTTSLGSTPPVPRSQTHVAPVPASPSEQLLQCTERFSPSMYMTQDPFERVLIEKGISRNNCEQEEAQGSGCKRASPTGESERASKRTTSNLHYNVSTHDNEGVMEDADALRLSELENLQGTYFGESMARFDEATNLQRDSSPVAVHMEAPETSNEALVHVQDITFLTHKEHKELPVHIKYKRFDYMHMYMHAMNDTFDALMSEDPFLYRQDYAIEFTYKPK